MILQSKKPSNNKYHVNCKVFIKVKKADLMKPYIYWGMKNQENVIILRNFRTKQGALRSIRRITRGLNMIFKEISYVEGAPSD